MTIYATKKTTDTEYIAMVRENLRALVEALDEMQGDGACFDGICRKHGLNPQRARRTCQCSCVANLRAMERELKTPEDWEANGYERLYADIFNLTLPQLAETKLPDDYREAIDEALSKAPLEPIEMTITQYFYGLGYFDQWSAERLADWYGVSRQRIYERLKHVHRVMRRPDTVKMLQLGLDEYRKQKGLEIRLAQIEREEIERLRSEEMQKRIADTKAKASERVSGEYTEAELKLISVDRLNLSNRSRNALQRAGVESVAELIKLSDKALRRIPNIGDRSITNIRAALTEFKVTQADS